jgi:hypothetical protein
MDVRLTSGIQYSHILWEARLRAGFKMCTSIDITNNRRVMVIPLPKQSFAIKKENDFSKQNLIYQRFERAFV